MIDPHGTRTGRLGSLALPSDAPARLREALGVQTGRAVRLAYVPGPGDVIGTYARWCANTGDERGVKLAYSGMFYDLAEATEAEALVCHMTDGDLDAVSDPCGRIRFAHTPMRWGGGAAAFNAALMTYSLRVLTQLRRFKPDAVILGSVLADPVVPFLPGRLIGSVHNTFWPKDAAPDSWIARRRRVLRSLYGQRLDRAVCISQTCAKQLQAITGSRNVPIRVLRPQLPGRAPAAVPKPARAAGRRLLYVGRIEEDKGVFDLLRAAEGARCVIPALTLSFVGGGGALGKLRDAAASRTWVTVHGQRTGAQVEAQMDEADLLVCPTRSSFNEGLATVGIEALVRGVPSVLSSVVPAAELLRDACLVFPSNDEGGLEAALIEGLSVGATRDALLRGVRDANIGAFFDRRHAWGTNLFAVMTQRAAPVSVRGSWTDRAPVDEEPHLV